MENFIQISLFCNPRSWVGAFSILAKGLRTRPKTSLWFVLVILHASKTSSNKDSENDLAILLPRFLQIK